MNFKQEKRIYKIFFSLLEKCKQKNNKKTKKNDRISKGEGDSPLKFHRGNTIFPRFETNFHIG